MSQFTIMGHDMTTSAAGLNELAAERNLTAEINVHAEVGEARYVGDGEYVSCICVGRAEPPVPMVGGRVFEVYGDWQLEDGAPSGTPALTTPSPMAAALHALALLGTAAARVHAANELMAGLSE